VKGASYVIKGFSLIKLPGIKRYVVVPTLINLFLFAGVIWYGSERFDTFLEQFLPSWLEWLEFLLWPLFVIASLLIVFFAFTLVANIFGAPFNGVLSEKIEERLIQQKISIDEGYLALLRGARVGISNEFRKLFYIAIRVIPLLLLFLIPGLNVFAPFLWLIFGGWMLAIEYLDYPMGNRNLSFKQQLTLLKEKRFLCLGFGMALVFMTITPVLNFFAMPIGVAAATALWVDELKQHAPVIPATNKKLDRDHKNAL